MYFYNKGYGLHDAKVSEIKVDGNKIILYFDKGIYLIDKNGKENKLTDRCKIVVRVKNEEWENCIDIIRFHKKRYKSINLIDFNNLVTEFSFDVLDEFYSGFSKSIILFGYTGKYRIELNILDVDDISLFYI